VANFRVYDKFVGEDQALEIWDAQKDAFGRAKSSMTLYKGRLGLGTTEPEGRLAVLDEPHNLEEFPPRAMTGYKNYFEGHGEFCVSTSDFPLYGVPILTWHQAHDLADTLSGGNPLYEPIWYDPSVDPAIAYYGANIASPAVWSYGAAQELATLLASLPNLSRKIWIFWVQNSPTTYILLGYDVADGPSPSPVGGYPYQTFNKNSALTDYLESAASTYTSTSGGSPASISVRLASNIPDGSWVALKLPYKICLKNYEFIGPGTKSPKEGQIWGSTDGTTWSHVHTFTGGVTDVKNNETVSGNTKYYSEYAFITTKITGADTTVRISQWRVFGTREQGQSVLHDGQLTLTKNLNVPRIGPALDADDTPRRDRLVVEYNTSTNPTFEGAVRDTSGRGLDGTLFGGASYDATQKALVFDGTDDYVQTESPSPLSQIHSMSAWIKMGSQTGINSIMHIGTFGTSTESRIFTNGNVLHATIFGSTIAANSNGLSPGRWYHIVYTFMGGTFNTTNVKLFIDGTSVVLTQTQTAATSALTGKTITIGSVSTGGEYFKGDISNPKLYDTALTAEEVKTLYDMGRTGSVANPQPLHIAAPLYSPGAIVQVESSLKTDTSSTTSITEVDIARLSVNIHPKFGTSKIVVSYTVNVGTTNGHGFLRVKRTQGGTSTYIGDGDAASLRERCTSYIFGNNGSFCESYSFEHLDDANGTGTVTYQIQMFVTSTSYTLYINRAGVDGDNTYYGRTSSSITAKEVCQ
jgi:hypothetical protein